MYETARFEAGRRVRGAIILTIGVSLYAAFIVGYFTALEGVDYDAVLESMPPAMIDAFGIETLATIEGFLASQIYNFVWLLGLGLYFAYAGAGLIASDIERDRMELFLSLPRSRSRFLLEKFAALLLPIVLLNVVGAVVIVVLVNAVGETIDVWNLLLVHAVSIPYLLSCAAIGVLLSSLVRRSAIAERATIGIIFGLFLIESVVGGTTEYQWIQMISPTHYYNPTPILLDGAYEVTEIGVLIGVMLLGLWLATVWFTRRDI